MPFESIHFSFWKIWKQFPILSFNFGPKPNATQPFSPLIFTGSIQPIWPCGPTAGSIGNQGTFLLLEMSRQSLLPAGLVPPRRLPPAMPVVVETTPYFLLFHFLI
jgi:hypothetical protein